jgi:hypothetical protein
MKINTMKKSLISLALCLLAFALPATAQETKPESKEDKPQAKAAPVYQPVYKLDLAVYELQDGKRTNVRKYIMFIKGGGQTSSLKVGNRIPVMSGGPSTTQFQYMDVGLNLRCRDANEKDGMLTINTDFELGSLIVPEHADPATQGAPVVRQLREDGFSQIPMGKPSVVISIDDTNTTRTVQVEMTATRV